MKAQKKIMELLSQHEADTNLAVLPGPLSQEDVAGMMSTINRSVTGLRMLAKKHNDSELTSKVTSIEKSVEKLKSIAAKLPKRK